MKHLSLAAPLVLGLAACLVAAHPAGAQVESARVAAGLSRPVFATAPAGDPDRLFIIEKIGRIRILKNGVLLPSPFLDITSQVLSSGNEQGLLGLTFDPDYDTNGYFYTYYIAGTGAGNSVVRRYTVTSNPDVADPNTEYKIFRYPQPFTNHNGGTIEFGPDGYLYLGLGDGGSANDPGNRAQNGLELLGKMLRVDVTMDDFPADTLQNYAIPPSNPFVGNPNFRDEIWSYGVRNPYRWSFDPGTGDLWMADVGQNCYEEVNFQSGASAGGENWGWRIMEGTHCFNPASPFNCNFTGCTTTGLIQPIYDYLHTGGACSVTGGFVYRGADLAGMDGQYFFADYCSRRIWTMGYNGFIVTNFTDRTTQLDPTDGTTIGPITGFGRDGLGELYILDDNGQVFKILPESTGVNPDPSRPKRFEMSGGAPNPFLTATTFQLVLDRAVALEVDVYDAAGRRVRSLARQPRAEGVLDLSWDGLDDERRAVPAGVYFVRAVTPEDSITRRVALLR